MSGSMLLKDESEDIKAVGIVVVWLGAKSGEVLSMLHLEGIYNLIFFWDQHVFHYW